ncbi:MAG: hypothetical protein WC899_07370 [bacterium]|jgi:hypothetical protein
MYLHSCLPKIALALLGLFLFVSVSEAAACNPCSMKAEAACSSSCEAAAVASDFPGDREIPSTPSNHAGEDSSCTLCFFCLSPFIESSPAAVSPDDVAQRFALPEHAMYYEAPSFSFLRPPRS